MPGYLMRNGTGGPKTESFGIVATFSEQGGGSCSPACRLPARRQAGPRVARSTMSPQSASRSSAERKAAFAEAETRGSGNCNDRKETDDVSWFQVQRFLRRHHRRARRHLHSRHWRRRKRRLLGDKRRRPRLLRRPPAVAVRSWHGRRR